MEKYNFKNSKAFKDPFRPTDGSDLTREEQIENVSLVILTINDKKLARQFAELIVDKLRK